MKGSSHTISVRSFLTIGPHEEEQEFCEVLKSLSKGISVFCFTGSYAVVEEKAIVRNSLAMNPESHSVSRNKDQVADQRQGDMLIAWQENLMPINFFLSKRKPVAEEKDVSPERSAL